MILSCRNIKKSFGVNEILNNISFHIEEKEKAAIVGVNGAGKSTLFKILTNELDYDEGTLSISNNKQIGYLSQSNDFLEGASIYDEALQVFQDLIDLENKISLLENMLSELEGDELQKQLAIYSNLRQELEQKEGYAYHSKIRGVLNGLGFNESQYATKVHKLSGGQKTRLALAKLLLRKPDILLLDEPTNHLDINAVEWLEDYLKSYAGSILIISHDRYFLDKIVTKVIEIENRKSIIYHGNYSNFMSEKVINQALAIKHYENQQKEIKRQEAVIAQLRSFNREKSVKRAESREKTLNKVERLEQPTILNHEMNLSLKPKITSGNDVLSVKNLSKSFNKKIFENINFEIKRGEKIALLGSNGCGKTTLFRIIMNLLEKDYGDVVLGAKVHIGYYDQEQENLSADKNIFQEISDTYPKLTQTEIRNMLAAFLFKGEDVFKSIGALSGGERARVSLAKIMLSEANLLLLDEPTNHLDIISKEVLEQAISAYEGTVLFISHDRYFINKIASKIYVMEPTHITSYLGNYNDYIEKKTQQAEESSTNTTVTTTPAQSSKNDWLKQKELQSLIRKHANKVNTLESEIAEIDARIEKINEEMYDESVYTDPIKSSELLEEKSELELKQENLYEEWELNHQALEDLNNE